MPFSFAAPALIGLAALAQSQVPAQSQGPGRFPLAEAADCGIVFARMSEAVQSGAPAPQPFVAQIALGLAIWEYELNAAAPGEQEATKEAVLAAVDRLDAGMPGEEADPGARGDFLMAKAAVCGERIDAAYPDASHPVIARVRTMAAEQRKAQEEGAAPAP